MANGIESGQGVEALLLAGLLGGQRTAAPDVGGVSSPSLSMLQNLIGTSPVFERGRNVGGLGQIGRALAPATASVVAAPLLRQKAQAEAEQLKLEKLRVISQINLNDAKTRKLILEEGGEDALAALEERQKLAALLGLEPSGISGKGEVSFARPRKASEVAQAIRGLAGAQTRLQMLLEADKAGKVADPNAPPVIKDGELIEGAFIEKPPTAIITEAFQSRAKMGLLKTAMKTLDRALTVAPDALNVKGRLEQIVQGLGQLDQASLTQLTDAAIADAERNNSVLQGNVDTTQFSPELGLARGALRAIAYLKSRAINGEGARMSDFDVQNSLIELTGGEDVFTGGIQAATVKSNMAGLVLPQIRAREREINEIFKLTEIRALSPTASPTPTPTPTKRPRRDRPNILGILPE